MPKNFPNLSKLRLYYTGNQYNMFLLFSISFILLLFNIIDRLFFEEQIKGKKKIGTKD